MTEFSDFPEEKPRGVTQKQIARIVYILYGIGFVGGLGAVAGLVLAYDNARALDPIVASHFQTQIKMFWIGVFWLCLAFLTFSVFFLGWAILASWAGWTVYKIVTGLIALNQDQPARR